MRCTEYQKYSNHRLYKFQLNIIKLCHHNIALLTTNQIDMKCNVPRNNFNWNQTLINVYVPEELNHHHKINKIHVSHSSQSCRRSQSPNRPWRLQKCNKMPCKSHEIKNYAALTSAQKKADIAKSHVIINLSADILTRGLLT